jgi:hypothetical protein
MKNHLIPDKIHQDLIDKKISKKDALKLYESILTKSDIEEFRYKVIEDLSNIAFKREEVYKILESSLISDESVLIRCAVAKTLIEKFSDFDLSPLLWAIENENSIFFFKHILISLNNQITANIDILKQKILTKLKNHYNLNYNDARFILDIDYLDYRKFKLELSDFLSTFTLTELEIQELIKENSTLGFKGLARIKTVEDGYILNLTLKDLDEIPDSICNLDRLKTLEISFCKLKNLPHNCKNLESLNSLVVINSQLEFLPDWFIIYAKSEKRTSHYIAEGVVPSEAYILVIMEILSGHKCSRVKEVSLIEYFISVCYRINEKGNIIGLYYSNRRSQIGIFPKELCALNYLEEINLSHQKIKKIPTCIINLNKLRLLHLNHNQISIIPRKLSELKTAQLIDLSDNPLGDIPEFVKALPFFKI